MDKVDQIQELVDLLSILPVKEMIIINQVEYSSKTHFLQE